MKEYKIVAPKGTVIDESKLKEGKIEFIAEEKKLPESWKELQKIPIERAWYIDYYGKTLNIKEDVDQALNTNCDDSHAVWPTEEEATASIALAKLCQLRDIYNGEVLKDWCDWSNIEQLKWVIYFSNQILYTTGNWGLHKVLAFKTEELRDKFLSCPEIVKLIETAKPLL